MRLFICVIAAALSAPLLPAQDIDPGQLAFQSRCSRCHGVDGAGGEMGPDIRNRLAANSNEQLAKLFHDGSGGMPPVPVTAAELAPLTRFLRTLQPRRRPVVPVTATTVDGKRLDGELLNQGFADLQMRTQDGRIHLLRRVGDRFREAQPGVNWPGYNGDPGGNRYTKLDQITKANVARLAPKWTFTLQNAGLLQGTPSVVDGIMYMPASNECYALDAGTGRQLWHYRIPGEKTGGTNRGVSVAGDRVFFQTEKAHIIALNRFTGEPVWDTVMADYRQSYFATSAPLAVGRLIVAGIAGGEHGARGFLAAYDQATGKEVWRFWTVPLPGEPKSETWQGKGIEHGGAPTWFTGTYDSELDTIYWPSGNPSAEYYGDDRGGDNLYSDCILALDAKTGKLKWYYQSTPHDLWDWDATETPVVVDANWDGRPRKLLLHANRNGFFYVFDRTDGKLLLTRPFINKLTWASGIGADGRPIKLPNQEPSPGGTLVCPSQDGATNWYSPSFNPATGLFYVQTFEKCSVYTKSTPGTWQPQREYLGGSQRTAPTPQPERILRAIDIATGKISWELPQPGGANSWGGTLTTATGLVIFAEEGGALMAADATTGKVLWSFPTNQLWKASPMTYSMDGSQFIAIASGPNVIAFAVE
ncbi:MAG TPA: PQQ-binding-like beta-propeller repeat protein [Candidatus Sulfopaludibacter sp.]|jgi:alcohol dehydrogenase (cytochrome c)|nr:PQQ-binding-like beta-propeller repeat protein [Candidatus Sulfopaludibacter sp.]